MSSEVAVEARTGIKILKPKTKFMNGRKLGVYGDVGHCFPQLPKHIKENPEMASRFQVVHIPGIGCTLDMSNPDHAAFYDILMFDKVLKGHHANPESRFEWLDPEKDATEYLKSNENEMNMVAVVAGLKDKSIDIRRAGRALGLAGSDTIILAGLYQMCKAPATLVKLTEYFTSPTKNLLDIYYANIAAGSVQEKSGLYLSEKGTYMWNSIAVGRSLDEVILWMKNPENKDEYVQMKDVFDKDKE